MSTRRQCCAPTQWFTGNGRKPRAKAAAAEPCPVCGGRRFVLYPHGTVEAYGVVCNTAFNTRYGPHPDPCEELDPGPPR